MSKACTEHERAVALEKLLRLEDKYEFASVVEEVDMFAGWALPRGSAKSHPVLKVPAQWRDVGNLIKGVFQNRFQTSSRWRTSDNGTDLMLEAHADDVKKMKGLTKDLYETIVAICTEFFPAGTVGELKRAPFLNGVYDGLLNEPRLAGAVMAGYSPVAKKKLPKKQKKNPRNRPGRRRFIPMTSAAKPTKSSASIRPRNSTASPSVWRWAAANDQ